MDIIDLCRSDSDDERQERPVPRVSGSSTIDLTHLESDDDGAAPAVPGVVATPSSAATAWLAAAGPNAAPHIPKSPPPPPTALAAAPHITVSPPPPPDPAPAASTLLRPTATRSDKRLDKKGKEGKERELDVRYFACDPRILDQDGCRELFADLTRPKSAGGEGLGVKTGTAKSWCANRGMGKSYSGGERNDSARPWDERGTPTNKKIGAIGRRIQQHLGLDRPFTYFVAQIYKVDPELDRVLRDDYAVKVAALAREFPTGDGGGDAVDWAAAARAGHGLNRYKNGLERAHSYRTGIGAHNDKEQDPESPIVCLSLMEEQDATRPLSIKPSQHYRGTGGPVSIEDIELADGSLYTLVPPTNDWWRHELKPHPATRVSITFRRELPIELPVDGVDAESRLVPGSKGQEYRVTAKSCTCMSFVRKRFAEGNVTGACKHMEAAFPELYPKPAAGASTEEPPKKKARAEK